MPTTPTYGFRYPASSDPADVPLDLQELATDVETTLGVQLPIAGGIRKLAEVNLTGTAATIDFTSIPQTATHLLIVGALRSNVATDAAHAYMRINGNSGANYFTGQIRGQGPNLVGSGVPTQAASYLGYIGGTTSNPGSFGVIAMLIPDYTRNAQHTTWGGAGLIASSVSTAMITQIITNLFNIAGPVTSLSLFPESGSFIAASRATLYGLG